MSALCITCGENPRKAGRRQCGPCAYRSEDPEKARLRRQRGRVQRREYKRAQRRAAGAEPMEVIRERAVKRLAEREAKRAERTAANRRSKPWLAYPPGSAARFRSRYKNDPVFAQRERERAIVYRFTHPELVAKREDSNHWWLAAARSDGSVTKKVVRDLLRATTCYLCGVELTAANRSIDHRVALALGGNHTASNLAPCCLPCNRKKARYERQQAREARKQRDRARMRQLVVSDTACAISAGAAVPLTPLEAAGTGDPGIQDVGDI